MKRLVFAALAAVAFASDDYNGHGDRHGTGAGSVTTVTVSAPVWIKPAAVTRILQLNGEPEQTRPARREIPPGFALPFSGTTGYVSRESGVELLRILGEPEPEMPEVS